MSAVEANRHCRAGDPFVVRAADLRPLVTAWVEAEDAVTKGQAGKMGGTVRLARLAGVDPGVVRNIVCGRTIWTTLAVADALLVAMGQQHRFHDDTVTVLEVSHGDRGRF